MIMTKHCSAISFVTLKVRFLFRGNIRLIKLTDSNLVLDEVMYFWVPTTNTDPGYF